MLTDLGHEMLVEENVCTLDIPVYEGRLGTRVQEVDAAGCSDHYVTARWP